MQLELPGQISIEDFFSTTVTIHPKPPWVKVSGNKYWCPYCNRVREFQKDENLGVKRCSICRITIKDYHVKLQNKLFKWA